MGLELEHFDESIPSEFICQHCRSVLLDPVLTACNHRICAKCFSKRAKRSRRQTCPVCTKQLTASDKEVNALWRHRYNQLQANCPKGCEKTVSLGQLKEHLENQCPLTFARCSNSGCSRRVRRSKIASHLLDCDFRIVECEGCGVRTRYADLRMHQIVQKCMVRMNLHTIVQSRREMDQKVKEYRRKLDEESFRREVQDRGSEKARMWGKTTGNGPSRPASPARSSPGSLRRDRVVPAPRPTRSADSSPAGSTRNKLCVNCNKLFTDRFNHAEACIYHRGVRTPNGHFRKGKGVGGGVAMCPLCISKTVFISEGHGNLLSEFFFAVRCRYVAN